MEHALGGSAHQFRLGSLQSGGGRSLVDLLTAVRAAILRVAFFAEVVLAIYASLQKSDTNSTLAVPGHCDLSSKQFGSNIGKPWNSAFQTVGGV